jgi:pectinesterase
MIRKMNSCGASVALLALLAGACTVDNSASREFDEAGVSTDDDDDDELQTDDTEPGTSDDDDSHVTPDSPDASTPDGGGAGGDTDAARTDAGGDLVGRDDAGDAGLTPEEIARREFEEFFAKHCPAQPGDVMMDRGRGNPIAAGELLEGTPTRPQLTMAEANDVYTIRKTLASGGVFTTTYSGTGIELPEPDEQPSMPLEGGADAGLVEAGADGGASVELVGEPLGVRDVSYASVDDWYPVEEIEDVNKIVPGMVVDPDGNGTHTTVQAAINDAVKLADCPRVFIKMLPAVYHEKIIVPAKTSAPPVTMYTTEEDASRTVIVWGDSTAGAQVDGTPLTIHYSATFSQSLPSGFQARNFTIANDYVEGTYPGDDQAAAALMNQGDQAQYENVRILGNRNTLYVKSTAVNEVARAYFRDCYVEGDEDFLLGRGTAVFDQCEFHSVGDRVTSGAVVAPSTRVDNPHGFLIINSQFSADAIVTDTYLGRQWFEGESEEAVGKVTIRNSILGAHIRRDAPWAAVERAVPKSFLELEPMVLYTSDDYYLPGGGLVPPEIYLAEHGNVGPGAAQAADGAQE